MAGINNQYANTLNEILHDVVGTALRGLFTTEWKKPYPATPWTDDQSSLHAFESREKNGQHWKSNKKRIPSTGDCNQWDLTKLFFALLYSHTLDLKSRDPNAYNYVDNLRQIRNKRAHSNSSSLNKADFEIHYNDITNNLQSLGFTDAIQLMEKVKNDEKVATQKQLRYLDKRVTYMFILTIRTIGIVVVSAIVPSLVWPSISNVSEKLSRQTYFPEALKPKYFQCRDNEIATITDCFINGSFPVASITGFPAVGKTSLSIAVGQHLRDNHGFQIAFVELRGINIYTNSGKDILTAKIISALGLDSALLVGADVKDVLRHCCYKCKTLIILDNVEDVLISQMKESFLELIKDIVSVNDIKVLCTSRKRFDVIGTSIYQAIRIRI
ncbi:uncharacterized protein [Amphiura filiformis]|uniref:uncharacterized protein isoform X2 n=1 Tax=Amphiura filiformis TaxID=82378 RepID=UPI003B218AD9